MKKETSIIFTGDIGFDRYMTEKWTDSELISSEVYEFLHGADHVVANVEGALCDIDPATDPGGKGIFCHMMNPAATEVFDRMHADIYNFANNHTMDAGEVGIRQAFDITAKKGIGVIGCGTDLDDSAKPLYLEEAGGIGLIGVGYQPTCTPATETTPGCFPWDDFERIERSIKEIKKEHRWAVVVAHGGEEFCSMPMPYIRKMHAKYVEFGADVVIAHHPHVPQNYEVFPNGSIVFYSLGNFIFDTDYQRAQLNTDTGVLLKLKFTEDEMTFEPFGTKLLRGPEHIVKGEVPDIFTNVNPEQREKLLPLVAKAFVHAEQKRRLFLNPEFKDADEEKWSKYFTGELGVMKTRPGVHMDFNIICGIAADADKEAWKEAGLPKVVDYLMREFEEEK